VSLIRNEAYIKAFGENLRKVRIEKGLSQEQLAILADVPLSQIGRIERGEINTTISTLLTLSIGLKCEPMELLNFYYK
jgi:transcriptional regulator with XRE-family HTH domain